MLQDSFRIPARKKFAFYFVPICIGEVVLNLWSGLPNTQVGLSDAPRFSAKYSALVYLESDFELIVSNMVSWGILERSKLELLDTLCNYPDI